MDTLLVDVMGKPVWMWLAFLLLVVVLLVFDLGVFHRHSHEIGVKESLLLSAFYITVAIAFGGWVWHHMGDEAAVLYLTGFVVEKSLAMDNIFVIALIFAYFGIPRSLQRRVLLWGIIGVIVLRALMIGAGVAIVTEFEWVLYIFAAFLIFSGVKMLWTGDDEYDVSQNPVLRFMRRRCRVTPELHGERFFVRKPDTATGKVLTYVTPLFLALVVIEFADMVFAVDSIPAIFAITTDPYIIYTSNIFAILGLRALYFSLAALLHRFTYLSHALAIVLVFIGSKIFVADALGLTKIPPAWSLSITLGILAGGIILSLVKGTPDVEDEDGTAVSSGDADPVRR
ncbi:TerC family protein [Acuticoccus sp. M5D2P5]|uniref:TerC family protein n=1 Tax=Acuticoccus kalidii TaxID=2910977 RepID=UPI001F255422|nr:TerC family protein [Acuticoccus kalidii]MCF3933692.1 TerC family protein [Acuticoccus kalidii]